MKPLNSTYKAATLLSGLFLSLTLASCGPKTAPAPTNEEAVAAIKVRVDALMARYAAIAKERQQLLAGLGGDSDEEGDSGKGTKPTPAPVLLGQGARKPTVKIEVVGKMGKADLVAPGSQTPFWPVRFSAFESAPPHEGERGVCFLYQDALGKWQAKEDEISVVNDGKNYDIVTHK